MADIHTSGYKRELAKFRAKLATNSFYGAYHDSHFKMYNSTDDDIINQITMEGRSIMSELQESFNINIEQID